jgi:phosphoribosylformylglycinamidine synthase subunit PurS
MEPARRAWSPPRTGCATQMEPALHTFHAVCTGCKPCRPHAAYVDVGFQRGRAVAPGYFPQGVLEGWGSRVRLRGMARVVVDVMPKPEILDPQGKAVTGALARLGFAGISVRQGKRFELEVEGELTEERLAEVRQAAETLLANTVIETFNVRVEESPSPDGEDEPPSPDGEEEPPSPGGEDKAEPAEQTEFATQAG